MTLATIPCESYDRQYDLLTLPAPPTLYLLGHIVKWFELNEDGMKSVQVLCVSSPGQSKSHENNSILDQQIQESLRIITNILMTFVDALSGNITK